MNIVDKVKLLTEICYKLVDLIDDLPETYPNQSRMRRIRNMLKQLEG